MEKITLIKIATVSPGDPYSSVEIGGYPDRQESGKHLKRLFFFFTKR